MKTKLSIAILSVLALGAVSSHAQTAAAAPAPVATALTTTWVVTPSFVSQYMFRGVRLGGASFQPSVEMDYGNLALGVWTNFPISKKVAGVSDPEVDPYASYTIPINDSLSFVPAATLYTYPDADEKLGFYKASFEPSLALNYTVSGLKLTPKFYYDFVLEGATLELTAAYAVPLKAIGSELDFAATTGGYLWKDSIKDSSPKIKNRGDYWQAGVSAPFTVSKSSKIIVGFAYTKGSNNYYKQGTTPKVGNSAAVGRGVVSVSYAISF